MDIFGLAFLTMIGIPLLMALIAWYAERLGY
jgi:hypothetical protein